ncbi:amino acid ABC transporter ATP-binding protein [Eubacteriales bacterium mix99]|nr:glutamine ABC transporter ATP-binding protein [Clostridiales bacterium]
MMVMEIQHMQKSFGNRKVIRDLSLKVEEGQITAVIGPSGSGKSTLLRCATLLDPMDSGELLYLGQHAAVTDADGKVVYARRKKMKEIRSFFGLVFQSFNLFPHYSVIRNIVDAPMTVQKKSREEAYETGRKLLSRMGLSDREDSYPYQLSGGQQQRVSIARALALNPKILLFDEPTSALDPELTGEILEIIRDLAAEHRTMVLVTHEIEFAGDVADQIVFMDDGVIVEQERPNEILNHPRQERTKTFLNSLKRRRERHFCY